MNTQNKNKAQLTTVFNIHILMDIAWHCVVGG